MSTLGDFLAYYPDRERDQEVFNQKWNAKEELRRLRYDQNRRNAIYFNSQRAVQIFMGVGTGNEELFVKADPGIGKTCLTVGVAETRNGLINQYRENSNGTKSEDFKTAIILARNEASARGVFKKDIIETCTAFSYMSEEEIKAKKSESSKEYEKTKTNKVKVAYLIDTHGSFKNNIETVTQQGLLDYRKYSNRVIIIDEVHELNSKSVFDEAGQLVSSEKQNYDPIFKFLNMSFGSIKVLVTATPIVDKATDFVSVINLLLPPQDRITSEEFAEWISGDDLDVIRMKLEKFMAPRLIGRVSAIEASKKDIKTIVRSNEDMQGVYPEGVRRNSDKKLWLSIMDSVDSDLNLHKIDYTYLASNYLESALSIVNESDNPSNLYVDSEVNSARENAFQTKASQLENILWPDGTHGVQNEEKWMYVDANLDRIKYTKAFMDDFNFHMDAVRDEFSRLYPAQAKYFQERKGIRVESLVYNRSLSAENSKYYVTDLDIFCIMRVIRSRYSPQNADLIEQTLGIEYYNEVKGRWEYQFRLSNLTKESNLECSYIYNNFYQSGAVKTGLFYEMLGFERYFGDSPSMDENGNIKMEPANRYAIYYSGSTSNASNSGKKKGVSIPAKENMKASIQGRNILELFNHPSNKHGAYLKILIGLPSSAQSINLFNARQSHHFSRMWNEARNKQAENRADRPGNSHKNFSDDDIIQGELQKGQGVYIKYNNDQNEIRVQPGVTEVWNEEQGRYVKTRKYVKLFRHAVYNRLAFNENSNSYSGKKKIDLNVASLGINMYEGSYQKFRKSELILDLYDRCAFDQRLSNDPKYTKAGQLSPLGWDLNKEEPVDYTTYNLFYADRDIEIIKYRIRSHYQTNFRARVQDFIKMCPEFHASTVIKALNIMIKDQEPVIDRSGNINFIKEQYNVFFLVKSLSDTQRRSPNLMNYYCEYTYLKENKDFEDILSQEEEIRIREDLRKAVSIQDDDNLRLHFKIMPFYRKMVLFETLVEDYSDLEEKKLINPRIYEAILSALKGYVCYGQRNGLIFHTLANNAKFEISMRCQTNRVMSDNDRMEIRVFDLKERAWRFVSKLEGGFFLSMIKEYADKIKYNSLNMEFAFRGTKQIDKGYYNFFIQSRKFLEVSKSKVTNKQEFSKRSATAAGQNFRSMNADRLKPMFLSVEIEMYCLLQVYRMPTAGFNQAPLRGFMLYRLKEVAEAESELNWNFVINGEARKKYFKTYTFEGNEGAQYRQHIVYAENGSNLAEMENIGNTIVLFKHLHPAIMGWIFDEQLKGLDDEVDRPVPDVEESMPLKNFYPLLPPGSGVSQGPILKPYRQGYDYYNSFFDLFPESLVSKMVSFPALGEKFSGYYYVDKDTFYGLNDISEVARSIMNLPEYKNPANPAPKELRVLSYCTAKSYNEIGITVEDIYDDVWSPGLYGVLVHLKMLIYASFYLSKRIDFKY